MKNLITALLLSLCLIFPMATLAAININTANAATLASELPGIGPSKANAIIQYREENGPFASIDQLTDVSGIGEVTLEQIRDLITIGGSESSTTPATDDSEE